MVDGIDLRLGDCLEVMRSLESNTIDGVVTDPPYGLGVVKNIEELLRDWLEGGDGGDHVGAAGFMGRNWDRTVPPPTLWREMLRVMKPGAYALVFAGTRTQDLMGLSLRLAGFDVVGSMMWVNGSGFPKGLDVRKALDKDAGMEREVIGSLVAACRNTKGATAALDGSWQENPMITAPATPEAQQWDGYRTQLKPAHEPIIIARKPLDGTVVENVRRWGCGAFNIDGSRIGVTEGDDVLKVRHNKASKGYGGGAFGAISCGGNPAGRYPADILLTHAHDCEPGGDCGDGTTLVTVFSCGAARSACLSLDDTFQGFLSSVVLGMLQTHKVHTSHALCVDGVSHSEGNQHECFDEVAHDIFHDLPDLKLLGFPVDCQFYHHFYGERVRPLIEACLTSPQLLFDVLFSAHHSCLPCEDTRMNPLKSFYDSLLNKIRNKSDSEISDLYCLSSDMTERIVRIVHISAKELTRFDEDSHTQESRTCENDSHEILFDNVDSAAGFLLLTRAVIFYCSSLLPVSVIHSRILTHSPCPVRIMGEQIGVSVSKAGGLSSRGNNSAWSHGKGMYTPGRSVPKTGHSDTGTAARYFWQCYPDPPAPFLYQGKATKRDRTCNGAVSNTHPTVKPRALIKYLINLIMPPSPDAVILDPFGGSGTAAVACAELGRQCIVIERDPDYVAIARDRVAATARTVAPPNEVRSPTPTLEERVEALEFQQRGLAAKVRRIEASEQLSLFG